MFKNWSVFVKPFVLAVAGSLVLLNILGLRAFGRTDLTHDKIYTLSQASKETMQGLTDDVTVTAYFTNDLPNPYAGNARYVRDLLEEYRAVSKGHLNFEFIDPVASESEADKAAKKDVKRDIFGRQFRDQTPMEKELASQGIQPVEIRVLEEDQAQTKRAYMGIVIKHQEKKEVIPVLQDINTLEYDLTSLIRKLTRTKVPVLGLFVSQGAQEKLQRFGTILSQLYTIKPVDLASSPSIPDDVDGLFIIGPRQPLSPQAQRAVDQFIMKGKSVAFFLDSVDVDLKTFQGNPVEHGFGAMLSSYGITLGDAMVLDVQSAQLNVQERRGFMVVSMPTPYPFIPVLERLEGDSAITAGIAGVTFPFPTSVSAQGTETRKAQVLAMSSKKSWLENKPYNTDPRRDWRNETITPTGPYPLMVEVSGKIPSAFAADAATSNPDGSQLIAESSGDARIIVAGTSGILQDDFMNRANQALLLNITDWMLLDPALLAMRARGMTEAPLQKEVSDVTRNAVKYGNILGVPFALALFGILRWRMRESSRATVTV